MKISEKSAKIEWRQGKEREREREREFCNFQTAFNTKQAHNRENPTNIFVKSENGAMAVGQMDGISSLSLSLSLDFFFSSK